MRIIVDVMGGDNCPEAAVKGVCMAAEQWPATYIMVGDRRRIEQIAAERVKARIDIQIAAALTSCTQNRT